MLLSHEKHETFPFATTWVNLDGIRLSDIDRERQIPYEFPHMWNIKKLF